jgi:hypothetical protein
MNFVVPILFMINSLGALATAIWLIVASYQERGFFLSVVMFFALSFCYKFGASPLFMVASSILCFSMHLIGAWLPTTAFFVGIVSLVIAIALARSSRQPSR